MSLSHCWGDAKILKLTKNTLSQFTRAIYVSQVPKTFRDAFEVTKALGIRYIWIDSLCIIQDSPEDWNKEAASMFQVYQHAYCNIAATRASSSRDGLFCSRDPRKLSLIVKFEHGSHHDSYRMASENGWKVAVEDTPLNCRGWVVQERLISPRIIHFAAEEVFWDCCMSTASESQPDGLCEDTQSSKKNLTRHLKLAENHSQLKAWRGIVQQYSACKLTYPGKDRIVAISALAEYLQVLWKDECYAGLWSKNLLRELCWEHREKGSLDCTPTLLRAPTWSWLSFHGSINFPLSDFHEDESVNDLALVAEVDIRQEKCEAGNRVIRGHINLRCVLHPIIISKDTESDHHGEHFQVTGYDSRNLFSISFDYSDGGYGRLFCIVLYGHGIYFCILVRLVDEASGAYVRCGSALIDVRGMEGGLVAFQSLKGKEMLPCVEFDEKEGHLIKLL